MLATKTRGDIMADKASPSSGKGSSQKSGRTIRGTNVGKGRSITANTGQRSGKQTTTDSTGPRKTK